jgi:hypothetical protein
MGLIAREYGKYQKAEDQTSEDNDERGFGPPKIDLV